MPRDGILTRLINAVVFLVVVGVGGFLAVNLGITCKQWEMFCPAAPGETALGPYIDEYLAAAGPSVDPESYLFSAGLFPLPAEVHAHRVGKIAAVNVDDRKIDGRLTRALPADLVATQPAEVGTVVWVRWGESMVGTYHVGGSTLESGRAYQGYVQLAVIDLLAGQIAAATTVEAPSPPSTTTDRGDIHTQVDVQRVVAWLKALPLEASQTPAPSATPSRQPAVSPTSSPSPTPELSPLASLTLHGRQPQANPDDPAFVSHRQFDLVGGSYKVVFSGNAEKPYGSNVIVEFVADFEYPWGAEGPTHIFMNEIAAGRGPWKFSSVDEILPMDQGPYHLELTMPQGDWELKLTRVP